MTIGVLTAVDDSSEARLAALITGPKLSVVRRCVDLSDLLGAATAGIAQAALVSAYLRGLDLTAIRTLRDAGVGIVGVVLAGDEAGEAALRQLGVERVVTTQVAGPDLVTALIECTVRPRTPAVTAEPGDYPVADAAREVLDGPDLGIARPVPPVAQAATRGRVVAVWGPMGAPGRTTVAINLAAELAADGVEVLLVDLDTYGASIAPMLALLDEAPGVAAACRSAERGKLDVAALSALAPEVTPRLRVLTGLPRPDRWPELRAAPVERVLDVARLLAEVVIVDCGFSLEDDTELSYDTLAPRRNMAAVVAVDVADEIVVVGAAGPIGLQRLVRAVQELSDRGTPATTVVVNRLRRGAVGPHARTQVHDVLSRFGGVDEAIIIPDDPAAHDEAVLAGRTLVESAPRSPAREPVREIADRVRAGMVAASTA